MRVLLLAVVFGVDAQRSNAQTRKSSNCRFGVTGDEPDGCLSPELITKLPNQKLPTPVVHPFPSQTTLTVVSRDSNMQGDIKCSGIDDNIKIQLAIDNMMDTVLFSANQRVGR
jgi:hypothetical protein